MIKRVDLSKRAQQAEVQQIESGRCVASVLLVTGPTLHYSSATAESQDRARCDLASQLERVGVPTLDIAHEVFHRRSEDRAWDSHNEAF